MYSLRDPMIRRTLEELHQAAKSDRGRFLRLLPWALFHKLRGKELSQVVTPEQLKDF